jgi:hypothetical protein
MQLIQSKIWATDWKGKLSSIKLLKKNELWIVCDFRASSDLNEIEIENGGSRAGNIS